MYSGSHTLHLNGGHNKNTITIPNVGTTNYDVNIVNDGGNAYWYLIHQVDYNNCTATSVVIYTLPLASDGTVMGMEANRPVRITLTKRK